MDNSTVQNSTEPTQRRSKRRPIIAFSLATLAVIGIGAAATSASWTDTVLFSASASAATFDIKGSLTNNGTDWIDSNNAGAIALAVPSSTFTNLTPGTTKTVSLYVKHTGSSDMPIVASVAAATGNTFTGLSTTLSGAPATLTAGSVATIVLTVSAPTTWDQSNAGKSGGYVVTVAGQLGN